MKSGVYSLGQPLPELAFVKLPQTPFPEESSSAVLASAAAPCRRQSVLLHLLGPVCVRPLASHSTPAAQAQLRSEFQEETVSFADSSQLHKLQLCKTFLGSFAHIDMPIKHIVDLACCMGKTLGGPL